MIIALNTLHLINLKQFERADKKIKNKSVKSTSSNDINRFINSISFSEDGDVATKSEYYLDSEKFIEENKFNRFYSICTSLDEIDGYDTSKIIKNNSKRWKIERLFRILKSELNVRPV